jgi:hypothetical protein
MTLAEKMFARGSGRDGVRTGRVTAADRRHFEDLFANDWDVFVIKHDAARGKFDWFTLCCETSNANCDNLITAACAA